MKAALPIVKLAIVTCSTLHAQSLPPIPLWPDGTPGALGAEAKDTPTLTAYLPDRSKATGAAVVICPGGGYGRLASHEGEDYAIWLAENGIAGLLLKYRLGNAGYRHPAMLNDAARAMRLARANASAWRLDPLRIGIMGSSAGGHLAATLLTHFDEGNANHPDPVEQESSRPAFGILCYAVITMGADTHRGSLENLLGKTPTPELIQLLSNETQVTTETPPCFIWHTYEDKGVKLENSLAFAMALRAKNVPFELHIFQRGGHGMGLGGSPRHQWTTNCLAWLRDRGVIPPAPAEPKP